MTDVDLLYSELEDDLRATVRGFLADRCAPSAVAACYDGDRSLVETLWKGLAGDLGLAGLLIPEAYDGAGASTREAAVVLEELGRYAAPVPFLTSSVIATTALLAGPTEAGAELLRSLTAGSSTAALCVPLTCGFDSWRAATETTSVAGALEADTLLVAVHIDPDGNPSGAPAATPWFEGKENSFRAAPLAVESPDDGPATGSVEVRAVPASEATLHPVESLDMTRQLADVTIPEAVLAAAPVVVSREDGAAGVRNALLTGTALLASEQLGVAQWGLAETVAYLKQRRQFGRIVGGFQALKHRLADLYTSVEGAAAAARYAAAVLAEAGPDDHEAEIAARIAAAWCGDVAVTAAEETVQLHGGIGMTWEHPAHLYLKRAKADQIALGLPGHHRARLGDLISITP